MDKTNITRNGSDLTNPNSLQCNTNSELVDNIATEHAGDSERKDADRPTRECSTLDPMVRTDGNATNTAQTSAQNCEQNHKVKRGRGREKGCKQFKRRLKVTEKHAAVKMALAGTPTRQVAKAFKVSATQIRTAVRDILATMPSAAELAAFRTAGHDILDGTMVRLLKSLNSEEKLGRASLQNVAYALKTTHTMARLEQGLSTSNIATHTTRADTFARIVSEQ